MPSYCSFSARSFHLSVSLLGTKRPCSLADSPSACAAVAARFGVGGDFFLNLLLTICGYIPGVCRWLSPASLSLIAAIDAGHAHNFYIQVCGKR
jgi:hypothetical protein